MSNECYVCTDWVSEYGEPVCLGCYSAKKKVIEELKRDIAILKEENRKLLTDYLNLQKQKHQK